MEAAALYTFASAAGVRVPCLAHVTNTTGQSGDDFEKGEADGTNEALAVLVNHRRVLYVIRLPESNGIEDHGKDDARRG
jgi:hypothetical protein